MIIAVDFDGTIVTHGGEPVPYAIESIRSIQEYHNIVLFTERTDAALRDAELYLLRRGVILYGINSNPELPSWNPKLIVDMYIDDKALGCPLITSPLGESYVDWISVMKIIKKKVYYGEKEKD